MVEIRLHVLKIERDGVRRGDKGDCKNNVTIEVTKRIKSCPLIRTSNLTIIVLGYNWDLKDDTPIGLTLLKGIKEGVQLRQPAITIHYNLEEYKNQNTFRFVKDLYKYCDSSIWNYFYDGNRKTLEKLISEICANLRLNRYNLSAAWEYQKFNYRKRRESYIDDVGGRNEHGKEIVPFLFHSEEEMWRTHLVKAKELISTNYYWKILLVDDHARNEDNNGLSYADKSPVNPIGKVDIIIDNLNRSKIRYENDGIDVTKFDLSHINFDYAIDKCDALAKLKSGNRYDLILLDFKLKNTRVIRERISQQAFRDDTGNVIVEPSELGTDILVEISKSIHKYPPSPAGEYNFMFISAYPTAVQEEMMAEGLYSHTEYWFVRRGACPINTPWLFLYELHQMMKRRIGKLSKHKEMVTKNEKFEDVKDMLQSPTAIAFFEWLYTPKKDYEYQDIRSRCKNAFNAFLTLRSTYDRIKYDVYDEKDHFDKKGKPNHKFVDKKEKESSLIRSMFPDVVCYSNTFWEHMQHLIYLTAYGTNRQWPEMWEEMLSVSSYLNESENEINNAHNNTKAEGIENESSRDQAPANNVVAKLIRNYILNLKYQNSR